LVTLEHAMAEALDDNPALDKSAIKSVIGCRSIAEP
jgi:hypothetical protein